MEDEVFERLTDIMIKFGLTLDDPTRDRIVYSHQKLPVEIDKPLAALADLYQELGEDRAAAGPSRYETNRADRRAMDNMRAEISKLKREAAERQSPHEMKAKIGNFLNGVTQ